MAVTIKSKKEIELMREAGKMLEEVHNKLADFVKPGNFYIRDRPVWRESDQRAWMCTELLKL